MSERLLYEDISPDEEGQLPLPQDWIRTIKNKNGTNIRIYRNVKTGQELDEHPIIARSMNVAKKLPLPQGWSLQDSKTATGEVERFYYHADSQQSIWDHPLLRSCVADYLGVIGLDADSVGFRTKLALQDSFAESKQIPPTDVDPRLSPNKPDELDPPNSSPSLLDRRFGKKLSMTDLDEIDGDESPGKRSPLDTASPPHYPMFSEEVTARDQSPPKLKRDWEGLLEEFKEPIHLFEEKISHRVGNVPPPVTKAGVKILREDVIAANERSHQLLTKLRTMLASKAGYQCNFLYHDGENEGEEKSVVTLASDIVTTLRQQPELIIMAIASNNNSIGNVAMVQTAFVAVNRLLHPFSTDNSMTTALLLQGINFQLEEMAQVEQIFCNPDSKMIIPRALCIYDPVQAVKWNPVDSPMPVVPNVPSETVFACLMRMYAIRRDVTAYFRAVWKPVLSSIASLISNEYDPSDPLVLINLITLAYRLLECTFHEKSMTVFPTIATAISRAIYEIGGQEAMLSVIFNFLIIPNMVKIFGGDHDSVENEDVYRVDGVVKVINKYFDHSWWMHENAKRKDDASLVILKSFMWIVWRLFSCSIYLPEAALTAITVPEFITGRLSAINCSGLKDFKLRNMLEKTRRKITPGCGWLIRMPLDINGNNYFGVEFDHQLDQLSANNETNDLLHRRVSSLAFKPNEMLNCTVVSRYELCSFLSDLGCAMDDQGYPFDSPIYRAIADFLSVYANEEEDINDNSKEEFMQLSFLYASRDNEDDAAEAKSSIIPANVQDQIQDEYRQLVLGLKLANRYEDTLLNLIRKLNEGVVSNIFELLLDSHWYLEPEFDYDFQVNHVNIAEKTTEGWNGKIKSSQNGLKQSRQINVFPLFSQHNQQDYHPNIKSMAALQKDVIASYRFGSAQPGVDVGTSFARSTGVRPPKVDSGKVKVTTLYDHAPPGMGSKREGGSQYSSRSAASSAKNHNMRRSQFTESAIDPKSSILAPTKSVRNSKKPDIETPMDRDKKFMKNMRGYHVIPTDEFQMRYFRRRQAASNINPLPKEDRQRRSDRRPVAESYAAAPPPKPFPTHLRHLIRQDDQEETPADDLYDAIHQYEELKQQFRHGSPPNARMPNRTQPHRNHNTQASNSDADFFKSLIADYQSTIQPVASKPTESNSPVLEAKPTNFYSQYPLRYRSIGSAASRARSRSPGHLPQPLENTNLMAPTESLLRKLEPESISAEFMRDVHERKPPELRKYDDEPQVQHAEPFRPTKYKSYPVTGVRAARVPEFLQASDDEYTSGRSRSHSRGSTPSRGRSRSRSTSPGTRSRNGSDTYAKPTKASLQKLSERALKTSQPEGPSGEITINDNGNDSPRSSLSSSPSKSARKKAFSVAEPVLMEEEFIQPEVPTSNDALQTESERPEPKTNVVSVKKLKAKVRVSRSPTPPNHERRSSSPSAVSQAANGNGQKHSFAEAVANALNEAATFDNNNTMYHMSFSPEVDHHRSVVNLKEDREQILERRKQLLQQRFDDDEFDELDGKCIEDRPKNAPSGQKSAAANHSTTNESDILSPAKVPIVKRRSLIKSVNMNKEMFMNGFIAKKVSNFFLLNNLKSFVTRIIFLSMDVRESQR